MMSNRLRSCLGRALPFVLLGLGLSGCLDGGFGGKGVAPPPPMPARATQGVLPSVTPLTVGSPPSRRIPSATPPPPPTATDPVFVGAGDIGDCGSRRPEQTAALLDRIPGTVFTLGDNAYDEGTARQFQDCYDPTWGRYKARTRPVPGNHDYLTAAGVAYYAYFGPLAGPPAQGYYSYDLGAWHIVALNSNIAMDAGSVQEQWLRADLAAHPARCTLAYWHEPLFTSGLHRDEPKARPIWRALYAAGADVVLNGHDHDYERFAPQDPEGAADPAQGLREFVVGTGGGWFTEFIADQPNSEVRDSGTWGVLQLTLHPTSYDWEFLPIAMDGQTFRDAGSGTCSPR